MGTLIIMIAALEWAPYYNCSISIYSILSLAWCFKIQLHVFPCFFFTFYYLILSYNQNWAPADMIINNCYMSKADLFVVKIFWLVILFFLKAFYFRMRLKSVCLCCLFLCSISESFFYNSKCLSLFNSSFSFSSVKWAIFSKHWLTHLSRTWVHSLGILFWISIRYPANITLLRGNHESRQLTQVCLLQ